MQAEERFDAVFKRGEQPDDLADHPLPAGDPLHLPALLVDSGMAESSSAARRLIVAGAVRVGGRVLAPTELDVARAELDGAVLAVGKRRAVRLR